MRITASDWYDIGIRYMIQKELEINPLLPSVHDDWIEAVHRARDGAEIIHDTLCKIGKVFLNIGLTEMLKNIGPIGPIPMSVEAGSTWSDAK